VGGELTLRSAVGERILTFMVIVDLEDGSEIYASNSAVGGALKVIANEINDVEASLARWLFDKAQRPAPLMNFDLRGLSKSSREAFWIGVERANDRFADWDLGQEFNATVAGIRLFYDRRHTRGAQIPAGIVLIDLNDLWYHP